MSDTLYNHLDEIQDPVSKAKLKGIQESAYALDEEIIAVRASINEKSGVVKACDVLSARLLQECGPINKKMDDGEMEHDEAKIRVDQIKRVVHVINEIGSSNRTDKLNLQGQIDGINRANKLLEGRFTAQAAKYDRQQRMLDEDREVTAVVDADKTDVPPPAVQAAQPAKKPSKPTPGPKHKKKTGKKVAKKQKAKGR